MVHNNKEVLEYWNKNEVESMYDKHLIGGEIDLIKARIKPDTKVLDAGCGEGEGTVVYSAIPGTTVVGADFSDTRLKKAARRLKNKPNVTLQKVDFLGQYDLPTDFDVIVSQRFLINLMEWKYQKQVLRDLVGHLKKGGRLLLLEGSITGVDQLNAFRALLGQKPIPVKWHNLFLEDKKLVSFMKSLKCKLVEEDGLGEYLLLTRGVRPVFDTDLSWKHAFNKRAASPAMRELLQLHGRFSRLKLWVFKK